MAESFYTSSEAKAEILEIYQEKLDEISIDCEFKKIKTSFGETNVVITGNAEKPPIVLIHGANGCAPIAIESMIDLIDDFKVFAVDVIGQPTLSAETRLSLKDDSYGKWMNEVLKGLDLDDVVLVGASLGGFMCWKTLVADESRIKKTFLIVPAGIVNGNPVTAIFKVFLPMKLYMWTKKEKFLDIFLNSLFTEDDEFARKFLAKVFQHFKMDFTPLPSITEEEARKIATPINIIAAEDDIFFPGKKLLDRASKIFPSLNKTLLLKNTKHVPTIMDNRTMAKFVLEN